MPVCQEDPVSMGKWGAYAASQALCDQGSCGTGQGSGVGRIGALGIECGGEGNKAPSWTTAATMVSAAGQWMAAQRSPLELKPMNQMSTA